MKDRFTCCLTMSISLVLATSSLAQQTFCSPQYPTTSTVASCQTNCRAICNTCVATPISAVPACPSNACSQVAKCCHPTACAPRPCCSTIPTVAAAARPACQYCCSAPCCSGTSGTGVCSAPVFYRGRQPVCRTLAVSPHCIQFASPISSCPMVGPPPVGAKPCECSSKLTTDEIAKIKQTFAINPDASYSCANSTVINIATECSPNTPAMVNVNNFAQRTSSTLAIALFYRDLGAKCQFAK